MGIRRHRVATSARLGLAATLAAAFAAVALGAGVGTAPAAPADRTPAPNWSGLDVRDYAGPIPATAGTLIAKTPLDPSLRLPNSGAAYRIHYSTRNQHHEMATSTGDITVPVGTPPPGGWPVIAWAHGTTGLGDGCTPSALPRSPRDQAYLAHWLKQGYAIVATDYAGLGTPGLMSYLNGATAASGIVDSVKAAQQSGVPLSKTWAIVGQSQGAGAALNGANRATALSAGSGLDYRGVVATGTPANIEQIVALGGPDWPPVALPGALNVYMAYIIAGFGEAHPEKHVEQILTPAGRTLVAKAKTLCYAEMKEVATGVKIRDVLAKPVTSIPGAREALTEYMGTPYRGYDRPIFLGQGLLDVDVPAPSALSLAAQMTAHRQPLELHIYPDQDHSGTVLASLPDSTPFLARVMR